jgi:hypothetical protein
MILQLRNIILSVSPHCLPMEIPNVMITLLNPSNMGALQPHHPLTIEQFIHPIISELPDV